MNDPFKNFKPLSSFNGNQKSNKSAPKGDSFVEQIKGIGSSTVDSFKTDVVKGTAQTIFDQLIGSTQTGEVPKNNQPDSKLFEKWLEERDKKVAETAKSEERTFQRERTSEKVLFSLADENLKREIDGVRQELAALVKTMGKVEKQIEQAVMTEVVDAGVYHLNFFKKLATWLRIMRKSLEDASLWMELSAGRGKRSHYWNQVNKSGSKYSMSSERTIATSIG